MKYRIVLSFLSAGLLLFGSGCRKWLDVNKNPNSTTDVPVEMLLPAAQVSIASAVGVDLQVNGSIWAQYWTQSPSASQYKIYEQYSPSASDYDREWALLYSDALMDLDAMERKAAATNKMGYVAIAKIMKAYTFQVITDAWGDIPFSQALKAQPSLGGIINPAYDPQESIYDGIHALLDSARSVIGALNESGIEANIAGDLVYGGDMDLWLRFANTLQLKAYLRMSEKDEAAARTGVERLYDLSPELGGFLVEGESAMISYTSTAGNQNPLFSEMSGLNFTQNLVASRTVVDSMNANDDYRAYALFSLLSSGVVGLTQGAYNVPASTPVSIPTAYTGARASDDNSALAPVRLLSDYESLFLQAEAVARTWGSGDDEQLFYDGLTANFHAMESSFQTEIEVSSDDALFVYLNGDTSVPNPPAYWGQYPTGGSVDQKLRHIITQKWFSMTGTQGFEAWVEWRRTGYPDFFVYSANSIIGDKWPTRFLYPDIEQSTNQSFPGQQFVTGKVWWDAN